MAITVDEQIWDAQGQGAATLGDAIGLLGAQMGKCGKVIVQVKVDGEEIQGDALAQARAGVIGERNVAFCTTSQTELAKRMIGRLAALVEYVGKQHGRIAELVEKGQRAKGLEELGSLFNSWQQIQQSYGSLLQLINTGLDELMVREIPAAEVVADFRRQLGEIAEALKNQDMVLLADILQYEMDSAIANWTGLLEAALGVVEKMETNIQKESLPLPVS